MQLNAGFNLINRFQVHYSWFIGSILYCIRENIQQHWRGLIHSKSCCTCMWFSVENFFNLHSATPVLLWSIILRWLHKRNNWTLNSNKEHLSLKAIKNFEFSPLMIDRSNEFKKSSVSCVIFSYLIDVLQSKSLLSILLFSRLFVLMCRIHKELITKGFVSKQSLEIETTFRLILTRHTEKMEDYWKNSVSRELIPLFLKIRIIWIQLSQEISLLKNEFMTLISIINGIFIEIVYHFSF